MPLPGLSIRRAECLCGELLELIRVPQAAMASSGGFVLGQELQVSLAGFVASEMTLLLSLHALRVVNQRVQIRVASEAHHIDHARVIGEVAYHPLGPRT